MSKKTISNIISFAAVAILGLGLVGCGQSQPAQVGTTAAQNTDSATVVEEALEELTSDSDSFFPFGEEFYDGRWYTGDLSATDGSVKASDIYGVMEYTPQMFYGDYRLNHPKDGLQTQYASKNFLANCAWTSARNISKLFGEGTVSTIPYRIVAGNAELDNALITDTNHSWCQVFYATKNGGDGVSFLAAYTVSGKTITFTPVSDWSFDETTGALSYEFTGEDISYDFEFCGPKLTLTNGTDSYTLIERDFTSWLSYVTEHSVSVESSLSPHSRKVGDITGIDMTVTLTEEGQLNMKKCSFTLKTADKSGTEKTCSGIAKWDEDGLFTFSYKDAKGEISTYQMVMFFCGFDGLVLSDGKRNYYYLSTFLSDASTSHYTVEDLGMNVSEEDQEILETLTDEEIEELVEIRGDLLADLGSAFAANGIAAQIDEETGEIVLDSSILFQTGQSALSTEGKKALEAFITAFSSVISDDKYDGFISKVEVQGHTDTDGDYDMNMKLSQERADSVKDYSLNGVTLKKGIKEKLETLLIPVGYSYDDPVYKADGSVDMAASRRVEFIFFINLAGR